MVTCLLHNRVAELDMQNLGRARTENSLYVLYLSKLGLDEAIEITMRHYLALAIQCGMRLSLAVILSNPVRQMLQDLSNVGVV